MPGIARVVEYAVPPEHLWSLVGDLATWGEWLTVLREWTTEPPAELAEGVQLEAVIAVMGIPMSVAWAVSACQPPRRLVLSGPAVLGSTVTLTAEVDPTEAGSRATLNIDVENALLVGPLAETLMGAIRSDLEESLANLEARLA